LSSLLASILPIHAVTVVATPSAYSGSLASEEWRCIAAAVPARQREFTAGRVCARAALAQIGVHDHALLSGAHREPVWPPGFVGSITHCEGFCAAAVARAADIAALGIDAEHEHAVTDDLLPTVCTSRERSVSRLGVDARTWATLIYSAKESVYKAYFPAAQFVLEFHDVEIEVDVKHGAFTATIVGARAPSLFGERNVRGRFVFGNGYVFTAVVATAR
jgi:4'-phosphopantetheinyl transferase EntD